MIVVSPPSIPPISLAVSIFIHLLAFAGLWVGMFATNTVKEAWKPKIVMQAVAIEKYAYAKKVRKLLNYTPDAIQERQALIAQLQELKRIQKQNDLRRSKLNQQQKAIAKTVTATDKKLSESELQEIAELNKIDHRSQADLNNEIDILAQQLLDFESLYEELAGATAGGTAEQELVASFQSYIHDRITKRWSRPASARRGMQVLLKVDMLPNGTVVAVNILKPSGNSLFDRSAATAVKKASPFSKMRELDSVAFEGNFRTFQLLFNPSDLRL